ncbi:hypothetical protein [Salmonirosea aquatica]|uniref:DUF1440 domain-containing protein n=1 Tax=Salmonirosea aquatica TaxID=2654236 RepID=A0A7C9FB94_9BACT|nr:hypothetical protein [Cytophagaceae bacterium SJW1-29]
MYTKLILTILLTGLIAGTIDILSAIFILAGGNGVAVLKYVASGVFGSTALEGGKEFAMYGLVFHYIIAIGWTGGFILLYPRLKFLHRNTWLNAVLYGLLVQVLMRWGVLPLTQVAPLTNTWAGFLKNAVILMYAIGLPASLAADWFYKKAAIVAK